MHNLTKPIERLLVRSEKIAMVFKRKAKRETESLIMESYYGVSWSYYGVVIMELLDKKFQWSSKGRLRGRLRVLLWSLIMESYGVIMDLLWSRLQQSASELEGQFDSNE